MGLSRHHLFPLLTGRWRWENKPQAFPSGGAGRGQGQRGSSLCQSWGETSLPEQRVKYWSLASRNPTPVQLAILTRGEQWRSERSFSLDPEGALLLPLWAATPMPQLNGQCVAENSKDTQICQGWVSGNLNTGFPKVCLKEEIRTWGHSNVR